MARCTSLLIQEINQTMKVDDLNLPQHSFKQTIDLTLKSEESDPGRKVRYEEQYLILRLILSALLSVCGGVHTLSSNTPVSGHIMDMWKNSIIDKLTNIPRSAFQECIKLEMIQDKIVIFVKKSTRLVTYASKIYVKHSNASCEVANCNTLRAVVNKSGPSRILRSYVAQSFNRQSFIFNEQMPDESQHTEYKWWRVSSLDEFMDCMERDVGIFTYSNLLGGGIFAVGIHNITCTVKGIHLTAAEVIDIPNRIDRFMREDTNGNLRIWGEPGHVPREGREWDLSLIPVTDVTDTYVVCIKMHYCPGGMFMSQPEACTIDDKGEISILSFSKFKQRLQTGHCFGSYKGVPVTTPTGTQSVSYQHGVSYQYNSYICKSCKGD